MVGRVWLIGMMGSGKSTVGAEAARELGVEHHDTDAIIEARAGMPVEQIFETIGVVAFRDLERQAVEHAAMLPGIISTGGGAVLDERSRATMTATGTVIYLATDPATLGRRIGDVSGRPLLHDGDPIRTLTRLLDEREPSYRAAAHRTIDTTHMKRRDVVEEVMSAWSAS
jgi:shikimate kinase